MSLMVAALVPALAVVAAWLEAVSKSAGKLTAAVLGRAPGARRGLSIPIAFGKLGRRSEISPA